MNKAVRSTDWLLGIRCRFLKEQILRHARLDELAEHLDESPARDEAIFVLHRIAGVAGTVGYGSLGRSAKSLELRLTEMRDHGAAIDDSVLDAYEDFLDLSQATLLRDCLSKSR